MFHQTQFLRGLVFALAAAMMMSQAAFSEIIGDAEEPEATGFEALSPGNRKIAKSLYDSKIAQDGGGFRTIDGIAAAKQRGEGWGNIFKQLKEEGLIAEKNLGQVVSGKGMTDAGLGSAAKARRSDLSKNTTGAPTGRSMRPRRTTLVVTTANGRRVVVGLKKPGRGPRFKNGLIAKSPFKGGRATRGGMLRKARVHGPGTLSAVTMSSAATASRGARRNGAKKAAKIK